MDKQFKILLTGSKGRMGQAIYGVVENEGAKITDGIDLGDNIADCKGDYDALIDFSFHSVSLSMIEWAAEKKIPVVIGTTGHSAEEREAILTHTKTIPIVWSGNYSVGINLLNYLTAKAAAILNNGFDPEIIEMHHRHKQDAPSGTAERLLEIVRDSRKLTPEQVKHGREGIIGERPDDEIGMHAVRGGDVVGEHTVMFAGDGERLELTHKASNRKIFAAGAVRAAQWAANKPAGLYTMQDVLGLNE